MGSATADVARWRHFRQPLLGPGISMIWSLTAKHNLALSSANMPDALHRPVARTSSSAAERTHRRERRWNQNGQALKAGSLPIHYYALGLALTDGSPHRESCIPTTLPSAPRAGPPRLEPAMGSQRARRRKENKEFKLSVKSLARHSRRGEIWAGALSSSPLSSPRCRSPIRRVCQKRIHDAPYPQLKAIANQ